MVTLCRLPCYRCDSTGAQRRQKVLCGPHGMDLIFQCQAQASALLTFCATLYWLYSRSRNFHHWTVNVADFFMQVLSLKPSQLDRNEGRQGGNWPCLAEQWNETDIFRHLLFSCKWFEVWCNLKIIYAEYWKWKCIAENVFCGLLITVGNTL